MSCLWLPRHFLTFLKKLPTNRNRMFDLQDINPCLSSILSHLTPMRRPVVGFKCSHHASFPRPRAWPAQAAQAARQSQYPPPRVHGEVFIISCHPLRCQKPQHFNYCCGHGLWATKMNGFEAELLAITIFKNNLSQKCQGGNWCGLLPCPAVTRLVFTVFRVSRK